MFNLNYRVYVEFIHGVVFMFLFEKIMLNIRVKLFSFLGKIFSRLNVIKIFVVFVVGFFSRVLVNYFWGVSIVYL